MGFRFWNPPAETHHDDAGEHCQRDPQFACKGLGVEVHALEPNDRNTRLEERHAEYEPLPSAMWVITPCLLAGIVRRIGAPPERCTFGASTMTNQ